MCNRQWGWCTSSWFADYKLSNPMRQMPLGRKEISFYKIVKLILRIWMSYVWCQFVKDFKNWHHRFFSFSFLELTSEITQFWIYFKTMTSVFDKCQVLTYENSYPVKNSGRRSKYVTKCFHNEFKIRFVWKLVTKSNEFVIENP